ncbi:hypothetical protein AAIH32_18190 [Pseudarthrobacter oxydans]|uniref:hypothetical protein n=1 Tax=Pseudarthrobacter oxydans TaxID=1671 RepID=UPI003D2CCF11
MGPLSASTLAGRGPSFVPVRAAMCRADSDFGRVAHLADPMGGMFKVMSSPSGSMQDK